MSDNTDLPLLRIFVPIFICQNPIFRFLFSWGTIDDSISYFPRGTGSTGFPVYQQSFFSLWLPGVAYFTAQDSPLPRKKPPRSSKMGTHPPSRSNTCSERSCVDLSCPPQRAYPLSFLNKPSQVIESAAQKLYWVLRMDCPGLFS